jgi:hypothetical protein
MSNEWKHPVDIIEPQAVDDLISELGRVLAPVFVYIARGRLTRTMELRSWVVIRAVRKDLVRGESLDEAAKRFGVSAQRLHTLVREFRGCVPGYVEPGQLPFAQRKKMSASQRRGRRPSPPLGGGGKESFFEGPRIGGSASQ